MKRIQLAILGSILATSLIVLPTRGLALDGPTPSACPNQKASQEDARVTWGGKTRRCGLGVSIFGLRLGVGGPLCPDKKYFYPARQVCRGEKNKGTRCTFERTLPVTSQDCECATATVLGLGFTGPICQCVTGANAGHVEDFKTESC